MCVCGVGGGGGLMDFCGGRVDVCGWGWGAGMNSNGMGEMCTDVYL